MNRKIFAVCVGIFAASMALYATARVRAKERDGQHRWPRITQRIDEHERVILRGSMHPAANWKNDRGRVADEMPMGHMLLLLKRSPAQEAELQQYAAEQLDRNSPNYHKWITPVQFGERYGVDPADISMVTAWLAQHGFTIDEVHPSGMMIEFSGTARQVRETFHTEIHHVEAHGERHIANMSDPQIPAALAPVVAGIVKLNDFHPHPMLKAKVTPAFNDGFGGHALVAPDLATIYGFNPLFAAGISGQGMTVAVAEDTNVFNTADVSTFRTAFGLNAFGGTFTQVHPAPSGGSACTNPGVNGHDGEATLDAEWASAAAPSAAIELISCSNLDTGDGLLEAIQNSIESASKPNVISVSYGLCETENTEFGNTAYSSVYQMGTMAGISIFVSSGDEGAASCDANQNQAENGIGVSGLASTPYNVAVGGTDFADTFNGTVGNFWNSTNTATFGSAKSYIPEIPWNDSCASELIAHFHTGSNVTYGSGGFCNSATGEANFLTTASGSGGPSGCATGTPTNGSVVSGTCVGVPKPSWQSGLVGNPTDGVRDIPDVSLFAANGVWGHYYVVCYSDVARGGATCTAGQPQNWSGFGGTSVSTPIMAGIMALVVQVHGARGNPNTKLYAIAQQEYGSTGTTTCNSNSLAVAPRGSVYACAFYDVTMGDMNVNCLPLAPPGDGLKHNCYLPSGTNGVLTTDISNSSYTPAFKTGTGWDFATGIGTVNAFFLVVNPNW